VDIGPAAVDIAPVVVDIGQMAADIAPDPAADSGSNTTGTGQEVDIGPDRRRNPLPERPRRRLKRLIGFAYSLSHLRL
jgi:hypothetical protein